jgi:tetrahydromethanopterin S-methyltransferase subunit E
MYGGHGRIPSAVMIPIPTIVAFALIVMLYFLSLRFLKLDLFAAAVVGVIFGTAWEAITAGTRHYKYPLTLYIYSLPIGVLLGWGLIVMCAFVISHLLKGSGLQKIVVNAFSMSVVGVTFEYLGAAFFDLWDYTHYPETPVTFAKALAAYACCGILLLTFVQTNGAEVDRLFKKGKWTCGIKKRRES